MKKDILKEGLYKSMKFSLNNNIPYMQDFCFRKDIPSRIEFDVVEYAIGNCELTAPNYGGYPYGKGSLYVKKCDLEGISGNIILHLDFPLDIPLYQKKTNKNAAKGVAETPWWIGF